MEWVETTGKTIEEAKEAALDELGVDEQDAEFEVLEEPKVGLFGRLRSEGRIRARVRPTTPRAKEDRRDRRRKTKPTGDVAGATPKTAPEVDGDAERPEGRRPEAKRPRRTSAPVRAEAATTHDLAPAASAEDDGEAEPTSDRLRTNPSRRRGGTRPDATVPAAAGPAPTASEPELVSTPGADTERPRPPRTRNRKRTPATTTAATIDAGVDAGEGTLMDVALDEQGKVAEQFLVGLIDNFGLTATVVVSVPDDDTIDIQVTGDDLGHLIGPKGATLLAIQDLTRTVVQRKTNAGNGRIFIDVSGYRQKRNVALTRFAQKIAADVVASGQRIAMEPMSAPDRKTVHDAIGDIEGVESVSEGEDARRHVVIVPVGG